MSGTEAHIIHRYLRAYAGWLDDDGGNFISVDHERAFEKMNRIRFPKICPISESRRQPQ